MNIAPRILIQLSASFYLCRPCHISRGRCTTTSTPSPQRSINLSSYRFPPLHTPYGVIEEVSYLPGYPLHVCRSWLLSVNHVSFRRLTTQNKATMGQYYKVDAPVSSLQLRESPEEPNWPKWSGVSQSAPLTLQSFPESLYVDSFHVITSSGIRRRLWYTWRSASTRYRSRHRYLLWIMTNKWWYFSSSGSSSRSCRSCRSSRFTTCICSKCSCMSSLYRCLILKSQSLL